MDVVQIFRPISSIASGAWKVWRILANRPAFTVRLALDDLLEGPPVPSKPESTKPFRRWRTVEDHPDLPLQGDVGQRYLTVTITNIGQRAAEIVRLGGVDGYGHSLAIRHHIVLPARLEPEGLVRIHVSLKVVREYRWPWREIVVEDARGGIHRATPVDLQRISALIERM